MAFAAPILAVASIATTLAGGLISAQGAQEQAAATAAAANYNAEAAQYQAQVAANNQTIANANATYAIEAGNQKATQNDLSTRALLGNEVAAQASSGLDVNSGSAVSVRSSTAALGELSSLNIRNNAAREAYGYQVQGMNYGTQSQLDIGQSGLDTAEAGAATTAGNTTALGDIVGGVAKAGSLASTFINNGAFNFGSPPKIIS